MKLTPSETPFLTYWADVIFAQKVKEETRRKNLLKDSLESGGEETLFLNSLLSLAGLAMANNITNAATARRGEK